ncbi:MAG: GNAT family N-acetyltransferase, partial [Bacilli bacterium]|nr:GNAT family N-acetyltransferase [Bacilli bacterium]
DASCRKLGVGRSLMEEAEKIAKGLGLSSVRLNVYAGNDAEAFYDRAGYKTLKRILEKKID